MRIVVVVLIATVAFVGACSKPSGGGQAPASAGKPAATPPLAALTRPHPKPGLWQTDMSMDAGPGFHMTGQVCIDQKTEDAAFNTSAGKSAPKTCTSPKFGVAPGGGLTFDNVCKSGTRTVTSHGVISGDFNSAYQMDVITRMEPPVAGGIGSSHMTMKARWLGPCPPAIKPGQVSMKFGGLGSG